MDNPRFEAIQTLCRHLPLNRTTKVTGSVAEHFGRLTFNPEVMRQKLSSEACQHLEEARQGLVKLDPHFADTIALAIKEWAVSHGATHYTHWFQPLTGMSAEKHDAFIDWVFAGEEKVMEKFNGKELVQGEPDASSFPSGGLRTTYEARGYTGWDPSSSIFLWKGGDGITLCIPSIFFSWTGDVLDDKIPLLRSIERLNAAGCRLLKTIGIEAKRVDPTVGLEQEYFIVDRTLRALRPDLVITGRTLFGAFPPKGQELQDHYFGAVNDRILAFMCEVEERAWEIGIPVKTRHNEVAPGQYEVAPVFEKASRAVDHNLLLMEIMRQVAAKHHFACLLHEKPFQGLNGSGKHCNWSLTTDQGVNLFDPSGIQQGNAHFVLLLTAVLMGVHKHGGLLRASVGSFSNDLRLGGHEAPPAIISIYLGQAIEKLLEGLETKARFTPSKENYNLGLKHLPQLYQGDTDRNRTSPFAFTGNKFEFRALGSSASPAFAITTLNAAVAESIEELAVKMEQKLNAGKSLEASVVEIAVEAIRASSNILFAGDNYSDEWAQEALNRKLPHYETAVESFEELLTPTTQHLFSGILNATELRSRYEIYVDTYIHKLFIEVNVALDLFHTQVLPAAYHQLGNYAKLKQHLVHLHPDLPMPYFEESLRLVAKLTEYGQQIAKEMEGQKFKVSAMDKRNKGQQASAALLPKLEALRAVVDALEANIEDVLWPLPKYRELLFLI